jgi:hypothetical protein
MTGQPLPSIESLKEQGCLLVDDMLPLFDERDLASLEVQVARGTFVTGGDALKAQVEYAITVWDQAIVPGSYASLREILAQWEPLALEVYIDGPIVPNCRDLGGTLDGVYEDEQGGIHLVDHKTAKTLRYWSTDAAGHEDQATHYAILALQHGVTMLDGSVRYPDELPRMEFLIAQRTPAINKTQGARSMRAVYQPTMKDVLRLQEIVEEAELIAATGEFPANPEFKFCMSHLCPFYSECQSGTGLLSGSYEEAKAFLDSLPGDGSQ